MAIKKPAKSTKSASTDRKSSLADLWDETDSSEASNNLPEGEHEVRIDSMLLKEDKKKGTAVFVQYSAIEGEHEGKGLRQMYKLTDADGNKAPGLAYLMQSLELIGYKDIKGAKLKKTLQEITEEQPIVVIKAKENGQYMNAYLLGTPEDVEGKGDEDEDEDESESEGEDSEIEVGSVVTFADPDDEDETLEGTVESINAKKGTAKVKVGKKSHVVDVDDLTLAETEEEEEEEEEEEAPKKKGKKAAKEEEEEDDEDEDEEEEKEEESEDDDEEIAVKDEVSWTDEDDDEMTGIVAAINGTTATVKDEDGDKHKVKLSKLTKVG